MPMANHDRKVGLLACELAESLLDTESLAVGAVEALDVKVEVLEDCEATQGWLADELLEAAAGGANV